MSRVLIVAGEASSSLYAQRLLEYWKSEGRQVNAFGIGSLAMESIGFTRLGRSEELAVVGLTEVIKHFPLIRRTYNSIVDECRRNPPDFALLLDYPDFNLRLARDLKKIGIRVVYYISPQVWAWRKGRVQLIRRVVDEMLVVFPFEERFYRDEGVPVSFVGHPLLDELARRDGAPEKTISQARLKFGLAPSEFVLGLMPGSRQSELRSHLREQILAAQLLSRKYPKIRCVLLCAPTIERNQLVEAIADSTLPIQILRDEPMAMIQACDLILVASGTATLMVGLMEKPMVIMYRMRPLTAWLAKRLVKSTAFFGMVNLIMGREVVPELFQERASPEGMAQALDVLMDPGQSQRMREELAELKTLLGSAGATGRVAQQLAKYFR